MMQKRVGMLAKQRHRGTLHTEWSGAVVAAGMEEVDVTESLADLFAIKDAHAQVRTWAELFLW